MNSSFMVSERDKRILELLALKHEKRFQEELTAFQTHQKWKEEREKEIKVRMIKFLFIYFFTSLIFLVYHLFLNLF